MRQLVILALLMAAALTLAPPVDARTARAPGVRAMVCTGASPQVVVRQYFQAAVRHQADLAMSCFTPRTRGLMHQNLDPDWRNLASIRSLHLCSQAVPAGALPRSAVTNAKPYAVALVVADFVARYYRPALYLPNGKNRRLIYVIKQHRTSPWRIAAIA
jgi:Domain of unknown function (DUF4829)